MAEKDNNAGDSSDKEPYAPKILEDAIKAAIVTMPENTRTELHEVVRQYATTKDKKTQLTELEAAVFNGLGLGVCYCSAWCCGKCNCGGSCVYANCNGCPCTGKKAEKNTKKGKSCNLHAQKTALIFGITGQDGAYLTEFLLNKGYKVHGVKRRSSSLNTERVDRFYENIQCAKNFFLHYGDISDPLNVLRLVKQIQPDELYNLAAQSDVRASFDIPGYTAQTDGIGVLNVLEAVRNANLIEKTKIYQASTSELYGLVQEIPQTETTPFYPRSPYGVAKLYGYWITKNYREAYNMFAANGILFNHESPLRGETFVTRKITRGACRCKLGLQEAIHLGNLDSKRDWGYAKDYIEAMWLILQQESPDDYIIATGEAHSVREFVELTFKELDIKITWQGEGLDEVGIDKETGQILIKIDPRYFRPTEVDFLLGDPTKAKEKLGWSPKHSFNDLLKLMVKSDYKRAFAEKGQ